MCFFLHDFLEEEGVLKPLLRFSLVILMIAEGALRCGNDAPGSGSCFRLALGAAGARGCAPFPCPPTLLGARWVSPRLTAALMNIKTFYYGLQPGGCAHAESAAGTKWQWLGAQLTREQRLVWS